MADTLVKGNMSTGLAGVGLKSGPQMGTPNKDGLPNKGGGGPNSGGNQQQDGANKNKNLDGNKQNQQNQQQQQQNSANKKRKMNNGTPNPHATNGDRDRQDRERGGGGVWAPGPPGMGGPQPPFTVHRLTGAPAWDLPPQNTSTQTFTGRCRLFVANLPSSVNEDSLRKLFSDFGKLSEVYIGKGNQFAFIKMDTRQNAENAKNALDGKLFEGRTLRVRLAAHAAAIKVTNLPPCVSNELLFLAFSTFGPVERAVVIADDRGRSINEGIVEFVRKSSAQAAIKKCQTECLVLSHTPMPVVATSLESRDEEEGVPEKNVMHTMEYRQEREYGPRFAEPGSVEFEVAKKWKQLSLIEQQRRDAFEQEMREMHENFKMQMEHIKLEETTKQLREQLRQMEAQSQKMNTDREARYDIDRQREEQRRQHEGMLRQQEEQLIGSHGGQADISALRRQENELRQQANALQQLLDRQETSLRGMNDPSQGHNQMNSNMYGQPGPMAGPNPGAMMGPGPGQMSGPVPPTGPSGPMQMNPYGAPPPHNGPGGYPQQHPPPPHQQQPPIGPHHPHQLQPMGNQPPGPPMGMMGPGPQYNGGPMVGPPPGSHHTISMPPQNYASGPSPVLQHPGSSNYQLPKRNRPRY